jgi:hypothetical protein
MDMNFSQFDPDYEPESVGLRWDEYKSDFENFMVEKHEKAFNSISAEVKRATFLHYVGKKVAKLVNSDGNKVSYDEIITKLDECYIKSVNTDFERYTFSLAKQAKVKHFKVFLIVLEC